jgi:hypothetical protein
MATPAWAQQTQNRSEVELWPVGPPEELSVRPWDPYNLSVMMEFGGQVANVNGNADVWESHQNYRDGFKVFAFSARGEAEDSGALLTDFYADGGGWVNEPYSWVRFGASRKNWFDFRGSFRRSDYEWFFPGFARSQHLNDTERRVQSYNLTLFPQRKFRFKTGYSRNSSFGPTLTTFDFSRGEFPGFEPIRTTSDQITVGAEWNVQRWLIGGEFGFRYFRNDLFLSIFDNDANAFSVCGAGSCPNDDSDLANLDEFRRSHPIRGEIPWGSLNIVGRPHSTLEVNARIVYSGADSDFSRAQFFTGDSYFSGGAQTEVSEVLTAFGESKRPMLTLDGNVTWRPVPKLTLSNTLQHRGYNISGFQNENRFVTCGDATVSGCPLDTQAANSGVQDFFTSTLFQLETFQDRFEVNYQAAPWLTLRGGFIYLARDWEHIEFEQFFEDGVLEDEEFHVEGFDAINRAWLAGVSIRPNKRVQIIFNMENGDFTRVFNRQGPADLDRYRLRGRFEPWDGIRLNGSWFFFDNENLKAPTPGNADGRHTSRNSGVSFDFQVTRWERGYFDAGYSRNDVSTFTDVNLPGSVAQGGGPGEFIYILDDNYFYVDVGGRVAGNLYVDAGYRVTDSSGSFPPSDPAIACIPGVVQSCNNATPNSFEIFDGGIRYHQPHASLRYAFSDRVSWKFGWRYYDYDQEDGTFSDYDSHVVTTSMVLNF